MRGHPGQLGSVMAGRKGIIGVYITGGKDADTMATLDICSRPWHAAINARDYRPEARHALAVGLRLLADKLDEYKEE